MSSRSPRSLGCEIVVTLGALLADTPHSRPDSLHRFGHRRGARGPARHATLTLRRPDRDRRCAARFGAAIELRVGVGVGAGPALRRDPARARRRRERCSTGSAPCSTSTLDLTDLDIASAAWERSVADVVASDPDVSSYVERLEARYDETGGIAGDDAIDEEERRRRLARRGRVARRVTLSPRTSSATSANTATTEERSLRRVQSSSNSWASASQSSRGEHKRVDVDAFVVAVEHRGVVLERESPAEQAEAVRDRAGTPEEACIRRTDRQERHER